MENTIPAEPAGILAIDVGATSIKFCAVSREGELLESARRRRTPYPCTPERLVDVLTNRIVAGRHAKVGVGFPGEFRDGRVVHPGNLARLGGIATDIDPVLDERWRGYALQDALCQSTSSDVRVVNDATLAALGSCNGAGVELVVTLGTGVGLAMTLDRVIVPIRDVGAEIFYDGLTFDQALGEHARARDHSGWLHLLERALNQFEKEFSPSTLHLAGGNARRVSISELKSVVTRVVIHGNEAPLRGAAKLFIS